MGIEVAEHRGQSGEGAGLVIGALDRERD